MLHSNMHTSPCSVQGAEPLEHVPSSHMDNLQYETVRLSGICDGLLTDTGQRNAELKSLSLLLQDIKNMQGGSAIVTEVNCLCLHLVTTFPVAGLVLYLEDVVLIVTRSLFYQVLHIDWN